MVFDVYKKNTANVVFTPLTLPFIKLEDAYNSMFNILLEFKRPKENITSNLNVDSKEYVNHFIGVFLVDIRSNDTELSQVYCPYVQILGLYIDKKYIIYILNNIDTHINCTSFPDTYFKKYLKYKNIYNNVKLSYAIFGYNITKTLLDKITKNIVSDIIQSYYRGNKIYCIKNLPSLLKYKCHPKDYEILVEKYILPCLKKNLIKQKIDATPFIFRDTTINIYMISGL
ncbi:hypothetical protein QLL95_gp0615 [Cotonvirus japonicus]|uniref:Uncharacterized protein n=1 Tax=Cotonvirus japonicus TaxID=2811091 RepID=A0ABM7NTK4_9VIRU|nr:hypothetical protein QLL95_gp0615 [Cotonvirus japonicus]BCS83508.1 hypothetical protein [Cotonvirus japonicus]